MKRSAYMIYLSLADASWQRNLTATRRFSDVMVPLYSGTPSASATYTWRVSYSENNVCIFDLNRYLTVRIFMSRRISITRKHIYIHTYLQKLKKIN